MFKQITVFIENKRGRLAEITGCLADENINIHALSIADTTDFGILRLIVSDPDGTVKVLKEKGFMVQTTDVIAVSMGHNPGSLHKILQELDALDISVEYMYAFTSRLKEFESIVIFRLDNQNAAADKLKNSNIQILGQELLTRMNEL